MTLKSQPCSHCSWEPHWILIAAFSLVHGGILVIGCDGMQVNKNRFVQTERQRKISYRKCQRVQ